MIQVKYKISLILFLLVLFSCFAFSIFESKEQPLISYTPTTYLWDITYESYETDYDLDGVYDVFTNITTKNETEVHVYVNKTTMSMSYKWHSMICNLTNVSFVKMQEYNLTTLTWEIVNDLSYSAKPINFPASWCSNGYVLFSEQTGDRKYKLIFPDGAKAVRLYTGNSSEAGVLNSSGYIDYRATEFNNSEREFNITFSSKGSYTEVGIRVPENATINYAIFNITGFATSGDWYNELAENIDGHSIGRENSISVDSNNKPHISHYDSTSDDLRYCDKSSGSWSCEIVDSNGNVGSFTSIDIDSNDIPHISYYYSSLNYLKYANKTGDSWSCETASTVGGRYTSISLDSNDKPHISHYDPNNKDLEYCNHTGLTWSCENVDTSGDMGKYTSIGLDSNNKPHISYYNGDVYDLKYANKTGDSWSCETADSSATVGLYTSIAIDTNDKPHIAHYDFSSSSVRYCNKTVSWSCEEVDNIKPEDVSLDLDSNNVPHIAYIKSVADGAYQYLRYCDKSSGSWSCENIDTLHYASAWVSLKIDSNDIPHISYWDLTGSDLRYASKRTGNATNLTIILNGTAIFDMNGSFTTNNQTIDFTSTFQNCIENQKGDSDGFVTCTLNFSSDSSGMIEVHDFLLNFTSDVSAAFNIFAWWDQSNNIFEGQLYNYSIRYKTSAYVPFTDLNISGIYINSSATECKLDGNTKSVQSQGSKKYCPIDPPETILSGGGGTWTNHTVWDNEMGTGYPINQSNGTFTDDGGDEVYKYVNITSYLSDGSDSSKQNETFYNITFQMTFEEDSISSFDSQGVKVMINTLWEDLNTSNYCYNAYKSTETNYSSIVLGGETWRACYKDLDSDGIYDYYKIMIPSMSLQRFKAFANSSDVSITQSTYNVTSAYQNQTAWRVDTSYYVHTRDNTPTVEFDTNINANCRIATDYIGDVNYTTMGSSRQCNGGEGTTSHTCTILNEDSLNEGNGTVFISCMSSTGKESGAGESTSGGLNISYDTEEGWYVVSSFSINPPSDMPRGIWANTSSNEFYNIWGLDRDDKKIYFYDSEYKGNVSINISSSDTLYFYGIFSNITNNNDKCCIWVSYQNRSDYQYGIRVINLSGDIVNDGFEIGGIFGMMTNSSGTQVNDIWAISYYDVYHFDEDGNSKGNWDLSSNCYWAKDITTNESNEAVNNMWVVDPINDNVCQYDSSGNEKEVIDIASLGITNAYGISVYYKNKAVNDLWISDDSTNRLYHIRKDRDESEEYDIYLDGIHANRTYEYQTTANITTNFTYITIFDDTGRFESESSPFMYYINLLRKDNFNDSTEFKNLTYPAAPENKTFWIDFDSRDIVKNASFNVTGFNNGGSYPSDIKVYINNTLSNSYSGYLKGEGGTNTVSTLSDGSSSKNLTWVKGGTKTVYLHLPKDYTMKNSTISLTGFETEGVNYATYIDDYNYDNGDQYWTYYETDTDFIDTWTSSRAMISLGDGAYTTGDYAKIYQNINFTDIDRVYLYYVYNDYYNCSNDNGACARIFVGNHYLFNFTGTGYGSGTEGISLNTSYINGFQDFGIRLENDEDLILSCENDWNLVYDNDEYFNSNDGTSGNEVGGAIRIDEYSINSNDYCWKYYFEIENSWISNSDINCDGSGAGQDNDAMIAWYNEFKKIDDSGWSPHIYEGGGEWCRYGDDGALLGADTFVNKDAWVHKDSGDDYGTCGTGFNSYNYYISKECDGVATPCAENGNVGEIQLWYAYYADFDENVDSTKDDACDYQTTSGDNCYTNYLYPDTTKKHYMKVWRSDYSGGGDDHSEDYWGMDYVRSYGNYYPTNPYLDIGTDDDLEWDHTGEFTTSIKLNESHGLSDAINTYLSSCSPDGDGYCDVPLTFYSETAGIMEITNISVNYTLGGGQGTLGINLNKTLIQNYLNKYNDEGVPVPIKISSNTNGIIEVENLKFDYIGEKNITASGHDVGFQNTSNLTISVKYSPFNVTINPRGIDYWDIGPNVYSWDQSNIAPFGNENGYGNPFWNITSLRWNHSKDIYIKFNESISDCVTIWFEGLNYTNSSKFNITLSNVSNILINNVSSTNNPINIATWTNLSCSAHNGTILLPYFCFHSLCSECVVTYDFEEECDFTE